MKLDQCIHEQAIGAAARSGSLSSEQLQHAENCPVCESVVLVAAAMKGEADRLVNLRPLDASVIWRRAQQRARKQALARATLPIRIALACSCVIAVLFVPWVVSGFFRVMPQLASLKSISLWDQNWLAALSGTTAIGITATLICLALSSWFVAREQ